MHKRKRLLEASERGFLRIVKRLVDAETMRDVLEKACFHGNINIVKYQDNSPLYWAESFEKNKIVERLLQEPRVIFSNHSKETHLKITRSFYNGRRNSRRPHLRNIRVHLHLKHVDLLRRNWRY